MKARALDNLIDGMMAVVLVMAVGACGCVAVRLAVKVLSEYP